MSTPTTDQPLHGTAVDQAIGWLGHLWSGNADDGSRAEWQRWRAAHPDHERAWRQIEAMDMRLARGAPLLTADSALAALSAPAISRRRALKTLSLLAAVGGSGWIAQRELPALIADERTATGERRTLTLSDGTLVMLNTDSALDLADNGMQRRLHLRRGEMLVDMARDNSAAQRPLIVQTVAGQIRPTGSRFLVQQQSDASLVSVLSGELELQPTDTTAPLRLGAGQATTFTATRTQSPQPLGTQAAWLDGVLIASNTRLDDFIADLQRYYPNRLSCDASVAELRLSGTFPLAEVSRIPLALTQVLPVRLYTFGPWWTRIGPAAA